MSERSGRFHQRLMGRALLFVVLPTALVMLLVVVFAAWRGFNTQRGMAEEKLQAAAALIAERIDGTNRDAVGSAQRMAEAQMAGLFGQRVVSIELARRVLESSPAFTAAYFGYEPGADGNDAASLDALPPKAMDPAGRFIPYWFIDAKQGGEIELEPLVDMETSLYYQGCREAFERTGVAAGMITEPYVYEGKMIVEQVYPIVIDGKFQGVAGIDRALSDITQLLRQAASEYHANAFLVSSRDKIIAATTDPEMGMETSTTDLLRTRAVQDTPYGADLAGLFTGAEGETLALEVDPTTNRRHYFATALIPTGDWTLVLRQSEEEIVAPIFANLRFGVGLVFVGLALVVLLLIVSIVRVSRRVNVAVEAANHVAAGDLTEEIGADTAQDETGALLRALRTMTVNLNEFVGGVKQASIRINSTATQLTATSRQQESVANGFGASSSQIAAASREISATSSELARTMGEVSQVATETAELAASGRSGLEEMSRTMHGLDEATGSIADRLAVINDKAAGITGVVTTISKVADQTNLLSVNAAIEAEKAGEYGVGFLVVAREIRRLADQTAAATLDIEQMVQQMQSSVSAGVMEMDRFSDQVRRGVSDVVQVSGQLARIIEQVDASTASFERVNEGMLSQSQGADQISEAMEQLTDGATQTMEAVREYASAADDLHGAIASLKSSITAFRLRS